MKLKEVGKTLRHPDRVALEYKLDDGIPRTFPAMGAVTLPDNLRDDRCTWENLRLLCEVGHATDDDCVDAAWMMLKREVETPTQEETDLAAAKALLGIEPEE